MVLIYCVKCRNKTESVDENPIVLKNGHNAIEGHCSVCGTRQVQVTKGMAFKPEKKVIP